ncbi:MAG: hypothetical protein KFB95_04100 [Simkaniaceae bacterium]|nr:MAG: hypothetical protein KFB95_04100 [Simkaniaceae bacterium]
MKKIIAILVATILVIAGLGYLAYLNSSMILAEIISKKTMTPVSVKDVIWKKDSFTIDDIMIANPTPARLPTAMRVKSIKVDAPYKQYFEDPILITQIHLDSVYINIQIYNKDQTEGNWQTLMGNMAVDHKSPLSVERSALIKKLILTNIQIDLILSDGKLHHLSPIERLEFDNISSDKGIPTQEISEIIVQKMMQSIFLQKGLKSIIEAPVDIIKGVIPFL